MMRDPDTVNPNEPGAAEPTAPTAVVARWVTYQAERFPLFKHGVLVAAFSYSAVCYSRLLRTSDGASFTMPGMIAGLVAFICCLGLFLQLRIADEHKDFEEDAKYRPYRPVQRGLVTLRELLILGIIVAGIQAAAALVLTPRLLVFLVITWAYLALMTREFFCRSWLVRHPAWYMFSHMAIMPLIDLFATGCDWIPAGDQPRTLGLTVFLATSYFNGLVIEMGRKIRKPEDEEEGVQTYSKLWGRRGAVTAWLLAMAGAGGLAIAAGAIIGQSTIVAACVVVGLLGGG